MGEKTKAWYAVKVGRQTGLFTEWKVCREQVLGYAGAVYKGFYTKEEAESFLREKTDERICGESEMPVVYVDGSYIPSMKDSFSFGVIFLWGDKTETISKKITDPEEASMRNVAGEVQGALYAMKVCVERGVREMILCYDYAGIEKWCTGEWKANKKGTQALRDYYTSVRAKLTVHFQKVKSHTGVRYNEMADRLAKEALLKK